MAYLKYACALLLLNISLSSSANLLKRNKRMYFRETPNNGSISDVHLYAVSGFVAQTKCYGELGCYSTGGDFYDGLYRPLPQVRLTAHIVKCSSCAAQLLHGSCCVWLPTNRILLSLDRPENRYGCDISCSPDSILACHRS